jgi:hypothetical protein
MPPKPSRGGRISAMGEGDGPAIRLQIKVEGVPRTSDEFKRIRRNINTALRDAMERVGQRTVLPVIKSSLPKKDPSVTSGLPVGAMASGIAIKRDRLDVVIKSTLPKQLDRALGWIDFGGKRPQDTKVRVGPHVIVSTLNAKSGAIEDEIYREIEHQFHNFDFSR